MTTKPEDHATGPGERPRAVFSTNDFILIREAVKHYMQQPEVQQSGDAPRFMALFHRLGRVIP